MTASQDLRLTAAALNPAETVGVSMAQLLFGLEAASARSASSHSTQLKHRGDIRPDGSRILHHLSEEAHRSKKS